MPRLPLLLPGLALLALSLTSLGPVLDHHFAERQPSHAHIYLGAQLPDHQHPFQMAHAHHGAEEASPLAGDTVYLTTYHGVGLDLSTAGTPLVEAAPVFPHRGDGPLLVALAASSRLSETAVSPLERPPLA